MEKIGNVTFKIIEKKIPYVQQNFTLNEGFTPSLRTEKKAFKEDNDENLVIMTDGMVEANFEMTHKYIYNATFIVVYNKYVNELYCYGNSKTAYTIIKQWYEYNNSFKFLYKYEGFFNGKNSVENRVKPNYKYTGLSV